MYAIISAFWCYTLSVDVYFSYYCTLWMACLTFLLILCYCCCAHDNDVSHTLHREWGVTIADLELLSHLHTDCCLAIVSLSCVFYFSQFGYIRLVAKVNHKNTITCETLSLFQGCHPSHSFGMREILLHCSSSRTCYHICVEV